MLYCIGEQKLRIPEHPHGRRKRTPHQVVPWKDMAETCRTLDAICNIIPKPEKPFLIFDGIARSGFWGALFRNQWPNCEMWLNEEDESCTPTLHHNFASDMITHHNIQKWTPKKKVDIAFLDFDHFTLNKLEECRNILERYNSICKYLIFVDGACFGFKFGNLKHYNVPTEEDYYFILDKALRKFLNKRITAVSKFSNAATILLEDRKGRKIQFIPPTNLSMIRGSKPYKSNQTKKQKGLIT